MDADAHDFENLPETLYPLEGCCEWCRGCGVDIADSVLLRAGGEPWHPSCLRCAACLESLADHESCFLQRGSIFCRTHYARSFGAKCSKCCRSISASDWVRKARDHVYHLACFACDSCKRQLSTGEEFALHDDRVLCKTHYLKILDGGRDYTEDGGDSSSGGRGAKPKPKRMRTIFTEEQLQVLQANFQLDSNPDGQDLERIAHIAGLSKRVTQVWFQNSRARLRRTRRRGHDVISATNHCLQNFM